MISTYSIKNIIGYTICYSSTIYATILEFNNARLAVWQSNLIITFLSTLSRKFSS